MSRRCFRPVRVSCFAAALIAFASPLARAGDWYVDVNDPNCSSGTGGPNSPFCKIAKAVSAAASGDTIHIASGNYYENLLIDKSLTLIGTNGAATTTVNGSQTNTVFYIKAAAVVDLEGLTITNGVGFYVGSVPHGGGVSIDASCVVTISNCVVTANSAAQSGAYNWNGYGGGIYTHKATLTITSTTISNNRAYGGGGIFNDSGTVSLTDSLVTGNVVGSQYESGSGGGIYSVGALNLTRVSITSNSAQCDPNYPGSGGGIETYRGPITGSQVVISNNHCTGAGGGLFGPGTLTDSVIENNDAWVGGGISGFGLSLTRCTISGNTANPSLGGGFLGGSGGGVDVGGDFGTPNTFVDCLIENNTATAAGLGGNKAMGGGIAYDYGSDAATIDRCTFRGNVANGAFGGAAGLIVTPFAVGVPIVLRDCAFLGNSAADGGGVWCSTPSAGQSIQILRCTIGGNTASQTGGGMFVDPTGLGSVVVGGTIAAGNSVVGGGAPPDCDGTIDSNGYNCIGNTTGCTITGSSTGNLLNVDPQFVDPVNGNFTLQATSPCLDTGDPSVQSTGQDAAGNPRLLDGNLDRVMVVDMGAFEFNNVNLAITGSPTPGGTLTFDTEGTSGLPVLLMIGAAESEVTIRPWGSLFIDLNLPWLLLPWGTIPNVQSLQIPSSFPVPVTLFLQELATDASTRTGNFGNEVEITIQ